MSILINPSVITDGLVSYVDTSNPRSYTGTGDTLTDLTGAGNDFTLNGTYGNDRLNALRFINFDSSVAASYIKNKNGTSFSCRTISLWVKKLSLGNFGIIPYFLDASNSLGNGYIDPNGYGTGFNGAISYYNGIYVGDNTFFTTNIIYSLNEWKNIVIVLNSNFTCSDLYLFSKNTVNNALSYAFSQMLIYNRPLSMDETASNFLLFKKKYEL
jgi:hypothetical protein